MYINNTYTLFGQDALFMRSCEVYKLKSAQVTIKKCW